MEKDKLMLIGAHADDIEFNFGGTAIKYHEQFGYEIVYVMATNNMSGQWNQHLDPALRKTRIPEHLLPEIRRRENHSAGILTTVVPWNVIMPQRRKECEEAALKFFHTRPVYLDHPQRHYTDSRLEQIELRYGQEPPACVKGNVPSILTAHEDRDAVEKLAALILENNPEVIMTHALVDSNLEHSATHLLAKKAFKTARDRGYSGSFVCCLTVSPLNFGAVLEAYDTFVDISGYYRKKLEAIVTHSCQVPKYDYLELRDRGNGARAGVEHAESYTIAELSGTRSGKLTEELRKNHQYCVEHR